MSCLQGNHAPQILPVEPSLQAIILPGSITANSPLEFGSWVYSQKQRGIICKAALIPAPSTGPNIGKTNLLPPLMQAVPLQADDPKALEASLDFFSILFLNKGQLQLSRFLSSDCPHFLSAACWMVIATKGHFHLPVQETPSLLSDHFWRLLLLAAQDAKPQRNLVVPPQETFSTNHFSSHLQQIPQWSLSLHKINLPSPHHSPG